MRVFISVVGDWFPLPKCLLNDIINHLNEIFVVLISILLLCFNFSSYRKRNVSSEAP